MSDIVTLGDPVLEAQAVPVTEFDVNLENLVMRMFGIMKDEKGIGLAAPQIGISQRLFVVGLDDDEPRVFINPEIIQTSQEEADIEEGCLSVPGIYVVVRRPETVKVQARNVKGKFFTIEADGMLARVIQHENDHLDGRLFLDRLPPGKRQRALIQYNRRIRM